MVLWYSQEWLELWSHWNMASDSWNYIEPLRRCFTFWKQSIYPLALWLEAWTCWLHHLSFSLAFFGAGTEPWSLCFSSSQIKWLLAEFWQSKTLPVDLTGWEREARDFSSCLSPLGYFLVVPSLLRVQIMVPLLDRFVLVPSSIRCPPVQ